MAQHGEPRYRRTGHADASTGPRAIMEALRESMARIHDGGPQHATSSTPAESAASMLSVLRHSATVCTALGHASAHVVHQLLQERQYSSADAKPAPPVLESEMLHALEESLKEADPEAQIVNSLFAAPMLSAFMHAFHTETFALRTAAGHSEAASAAPGGAPGLPAGAARATGAVGDAAGAAAGAGAGGVVARGGALHVLAVATDALPYGAADDLSSSDGESPATGLRHEAGELPMGQDVLYRAGTEREAQQSGEMLPNGLRRRKAGKRASEPGASTSAPSSGAFEPGATDLAPRAGAPHGSLRSPMSSQQEGIKPQQGGGRSWLQPCSDQGTGMPNEKSIEGPSKGTAWDKIPPRASPGLAEAQPRKAAGEVSTKHQNDLDAPDEAPPGPGSDYSFSTAPMNASTVPGADYASADQFNESYHRGREVSSQRMRIDLREQEIQPCSEDEQGESMGRAGSSNGHVAEAAGEGAQGQDGLEASLEVAEPVSALHSLLASAHPVAATALAPLFELEACGPSTTQGARVPADVASVGDADVSSMVEKEPRGSQATPAEKPAARRWMYARSRSAAHSALGIAEEFQGAARTFQERGTTTSQGGGARAQLGGVLAADHWALDDASSHGTGSLVTDVFGVRSRSSSQLATSAGLPLALRAVEAMEQQNHLTGESLKQAQVANALQVEQLRVSMESNNLLRAELVLTREKAEVRAAQVVEVRAEKEQEQFLRRLADELLFGLLLMLLALVLVGWKQASVRLEAEALHCIRLKQDSLGNSWLQWYRFDKAMLKALRFLGCKLSVAMQLLSAIGIVGLVCYVMLISNVLGAQSSRPASVILFALAGVCGFCGFHAVRYAGGNPYVWLALWESLCALHGVSTFYSPALCLLLNGRALGEKEGAAAKPGLNRTGAQHYNRSGMEHQQHPGARQRQNADARNSQRQDGAEGALIANGEQEGQAQGATWASLSKWMRKLEKAARESTIPPWLRQLCFHGAVALVLPLLTALLPFAPLPSLAIHSAPRGIMGGGSFPTLSPSSFPDDSL